MMIRTTLFVTITLVALGFAAIPTAHAQTVVLTGHYDDHSGADGYDGSFSNFVVPADTSGVATATFNANMQDQDNGNGGIGLNLGGATASILGGQFSRNDTYGFYALATNATISGGQFEDNVEVGFFADDTSQVTITGGQFSGSNTAIQAINASAITVTGGLFSGNTHDFLTDDNGSLRIFGQFNGLQPGQMLTLPIGAGTFIGTLANKDALAQTFTYANYGGTITLYDVAPAPEPSPFTVLAIGLLGLGALALKAKKRTA